MFPELEASGARAALELLQRDVVCFGRGIWRNRRSFVPQEPGIAAAAALRIGVEQGSDVVNWKSSVVPCYFSGYLWESCDIQS